MCPKRLERWGPSLQISLWLLFEVWNSFQEPHDSVPILFSRYRDFFLYFPNSLRLNIFGSPRVSSNSHLFVSGSWLPCNKECLKLMTSLHSCQSSSLFWWFDSSYFTILRTLRLCKTTSLEHSFYFSFRGSDLPLSQRWDRWKIWKPRGRFGRGHPGVFSLWGGRVYHISPRLVELLVVFTHNFPPGGFCRFQTSKQYVENRVCYRIRIHGVASSPHIYFPSLVWHYMFCGILIQRRSSIPEGWLKNDILCS